MSSTSTDNTSLRARGLSKNAMPENASWRAWLAIVALAVGCFTFVSAEMLPIGLLGPISASIHVSAGIAGLLVTGFAFVVALTAGPLTVLTGRIDRRWVTVLLMAACFGGNALAAVATHFSVLLIARLIVALAIGVFWSISTAMAVRLVPAHQAVKATSVVLGGLAVAAVLGVPLGTLLGQYAGWHAAFAVLSGISLLVALAATILMPSMPSQSTGNLRNILKAFHHGPMRLVFYATVLMMTGHFLAYTYITLYLQQVTGIPASWMSSLLLVYGAAGVVGNFTIGSAMATSLRSALLGMLLLMTLSLILLWVFGTDRWVTIAILLPWGFSYAALPVLLQTWVFKSAQETGDSEAALSLLVVAFNVAIAAGAWLGGVILDRLGATPIALIAAAIVALALLLVWCSRHGHAH